MSRYLLLLCAGLALSPLALAAPAEDPEAAALAQRLAALQLNPATVDLAPLERLQAQQAIDALAKARKRDRDHIAYLAGRRVEIAETAARAAAARQQVTRLDRERAELLIEASRREAARARAEAEQLRRQAQLQAEEAEMLRQAAEAELLARQDAEQALATAAGNQAARLSEAQRNAARLAREEAELVTGHKLPASKFENRGEVFSLGSDAFGNGNARLSAAAGNQVKALAEYLRITGKRGRVRIEGYDRADGVGQHRAEAIRDALTAAGIAANRLQVVGRKAAATRARAAEIVIAP